MGTAGEQNGGGAGSRFGLRLPNILAQTSGGQRFEYYRDVTRGPSLFVGIAEIAGVETAFRRFGDGINLVVLGTRRRQPEVIVLPDGDGSIRSWMFQGAESGAVLADANQRIVAEWDHQGDFDTWLEAGLADCRHPSATERRQTAPVALLPRLFDPDLCRRLIGSLEADWREGVVSIQVGEETRQAAMPDKKKRRDQTLKRDDPLYREIKNVIATRLMPELWKIWWVEKLRTEAFYLACYESDRTDFFAAHRDNNLEGTAKRRVAVSIELNDDYEGGGLVFPEYSDDRWRASAGGGLAFSCSLMHEAVPVTRGRRYVLLAFLAE